MSFSSNLAYLMERYRVSNYRLSKYLNSSQTAVKNWLSGENLPYVKTQKQIAELFGVTVDEMLADTPPHIKGEHILPPKAEKSPPSEEDGLTQEFARIFDQLSPQAKNEIIAEMLRRQRQEQ